MPLRAGELDRRIALWRYGVVLDQWNQPTETWTEIGRRWAAKNDVSDGERLRAAQVGGQVTTRFRVRYDSLTKTLTSADRVVLEGKVYAIVGVKETEGRHDGIEITASTPTDNLVTP